MKIEVIKNLEALSVLLRECELPVSDLKIDEGCVFFGVYETEDLVSCVGLELFGKLALLRSLAISPSRRRKSEGRFLVRYAEEFCKSKDMQSMYLLTTTASSYFSSLGYSPISREIVPDSIKGSTQYSSVCPGSAIIMRANLLYG